MCVSCPPESWLGSWPQWCVHRAVLSSGWEGENESARNGGTILRTQGSWQFLVGGCKLLSHDLARAPVMIREGAVVTAESLQ